MHNLWRGAPCLLSCLVQARVEARSQLTDKHPIFRVKHSSPGTRLLLLFTFPRIFPSRISLPLPSLSSSVRPINPTSNDIARRKRWSEWFSRTLGTERSTIIGVVSVGKGFPSW